ncbi:MAG: glutamine amidotransferase [Pirellulaceae bacterium]
MQSLSFQPIAGPVIIGLLLALMTAMLFVGPSFGGLSGKRRALLALLRAIAIVLVFLTLVRPGCLTTVERRQSAVFYFALDHSRSMDLPHRQEKEKRWAAVTNMIKDNLSAIERLSEQQVDMRFLLFDRQTRQLEYESGTVGLPTSATGAETDIGRALSDILGAVRDQRLLGVALASDGVQNAIDSDVELINVAKDLSNQGVPLYTIPFGIAADVGQLADVAIANLPDHDTVFVKNRKVVRASLISRGFANQNIKVQLVISGKEMLEQVVDEKVYTPRQNYEEQTVELSYVPQTAGSFRMSVRAVKLPNEQATLNNELTSFLTVYEGGLRIALISNIGWWEQSRLRRVLASRANTENSQGIDVDYFPIEPGTHRKPVDMASVFTDPTFDLFLIVDVDSRVFQDGNLQLLEQAVASGKGLMMCGGTHSFGPGYYWRTPLQEVLPIEMRQDERQEFDRDVRKDFHIIGPITLQPESDHPLVQLADNNDLLGSWKKLTPLPSINRFIGIKPNAEVLLKSAKNEPVLVAGKYGNGRVLAFAANSTWLWYNHLFKNEYKRFWQQIVLWLAFPDGSIKDSVRIMMPQRRFQPSSPIGFSTEARTITGQPIPSATYNAVLVSPNGKTQPIVIAESKGMPRGEIPPEAVTTPGIYAVRVAAKDGTTEIGESEVEFAISDQDKEKANPAADPKLLARLADETKESGGRLVEPEQLGDLLNQLASDPGEMKIEIPQRWQLGQSAVDGSLFLLLFVATLSLEWVLRKKWGLV